MSAATDPLHRLADLYGIETGYIDAFGLRREVPRDSLRALLVAMGVEPFGDREIADRLRAMERRVAERLLEPTIVVTAETAAVLPLDLPDPGSSGRLLWRVETEGGESVEERANVADLGVDAKHPGRRLLRLRRRLPAGEHDVEVTLEGAGAGEQRARARLIATPRRCFLPEDLGRDRMFGLAAQLYGLKGSRDLGIGDFADLEELCRIGARSGASLIGVNPLHALFAAEPRHFSPYSPSNRSFLNPIYIALDKVPEFGQSPEFAQAEAAARLRDEPSLAAAIEAARTGELVDYPAVARIKRELLEPVFATFRAQHLRPGQESERGRAFLAFAREAGRPLFLQACFDTLHETMLERHGLWSWRDWPDGLRHAGGPEVGAFAAAHGERIVFYEWLQWIADEQLGQAQRRAREDGMAVGLYRDLAVGVHPDGATAWSFPDVTVPGAAVGAPPDIFNPKGQNWGLAPFSPVHLRRNAYRPLTLDLRQNMRHAGAIRIDHVMGLSRLFWIPAGASPAEGAYIRYPLHDLTRLIALASRRERCLVIGEDLGTVAPGFRQTMHDAGILSYRVLWFERSASGAVQPPRRYPKQALITVSTHDLPTLQGYVQGRDLAWRSRLDPASDPAVVATVAEERRRERDLLLAALRKVKLLPEDADPEDPAFPDLLEAATHAWLAATPSQIMMVQLEDLLGEVEQANLPGTSDEHPNWRRRMPVTLEELGRLPALERLSAIMAAAGRASGR